MKTKLHLITFAAVVAISLAGVGWWFVTTSGIISNILHPQNPAVSKTVNSEARVAAQVSTSKPTNYKPSHYLFFDGNDSMR
ncbi:MAG: hypothetical protein M3044_00920 [Thermoproteota archaeon]|nr:hypothetical protein [Thermoproteota archaeon]